VDETVDGDALVGLELRLDETLSEAGTQTIQRENISLST
jgi:hypothetical protein